MQIDPNSPLSPVFAFTQEEEAQVQSMLETLVRSLRIVPGGGKIEEGYWSYIYHNVRHAPIPAWSNLTMRDFCHNGLGIEMKLLQRRSPARDQGGRLMHPAATRTLYFDPRLDAEICKVQILDQFNKRIAEFRQRVAEACTTRDPDIRWGILLWSPELDEFLYFEESLREINPHNFYAYFEDGTHRGNPTRNLYIFEKATNIKRYSVTMPNKGAKLQPYFDIPLVGQGAYLFRVPNDGCEPLWLKKETVAALEDEAAKQSQNVDELIISLLNKQHDL
jgi:hypothetical protein